jgi:hypothetical protein
MFDPEARGSQGDGGEEVSRQLVVSRCDSSEVFQLVEESLDEVAQAVDCVIDRSLLFSVALRGDVRLGAVLGDQFEDGLGVVAAVGDRIGGGLQPVEQSRHGGFVGGLPRRQDEPDRQPVGTDDGVDLGAQSSTRTTDGVIRAPFFPPAACWWARTMEESIR